MGGRGVPDPTSPLLFYENPTSHFLFILLSYIPCPILAKSCFTGEVKSHTIFSEITDPMLTKKCQENEGLKVQVEPNFKTLKLPSHRDIWYSKETP